MDYNKTFAASFDELADAASVIVLKYFRGTLPVDEKSDRSPVTQADREIEQALRTLIENKFPDHGIIGEEYGQDRPDAEFVWVIDPIDGTRAFMSGKPLFGTIIGLMHNGKPVAGLVDQAYTKERWFGVTDQLATHNGKPIKVAAPRRLDTARLIANFEALRTAARWPQFGCDCYGYGLLAMGWVDIVAEDKLALHDAAGIVPIVTGAGGFISDWTLNPVGMDFSGTLIAASCKELAQEALKILA